MKSPNFRPETGRIFGIDWTPADEIGVASLGFRDPPGTRLKNAVLLRLCNGDTETGQSLTMSRARAQQVAIALYEASGRRWPFGPPRDLPRRLISEGRAVVFREVGMAIIMASLIRDILPVIDQEIEDRQHSGLDESWSELAEWSRNAHGLMADIGGAA